MRIFILEDDRSRMNEFYSQLAGHAIDHADSVGEGEGLFAPPYDLILLDHDLADKHYKNLQMEEGTGTEFARWLAETQQPSKVIVHSWNYHGRRRMVSALSNAGWAVSDCPFGPGLFALIRRLI